MHSWGRRSVALWQKGKVLGLMLAVSAGFLVYLASAVLVTWRLQSISWTLHGFLFWLCRCPKGWSRPQSHPALLRASTHSHCLRLTLPSTGQAAANLIAGYTQLPSGSFISENTCECILFTPSQVEEKEFQAFFSTTMCTSLSCLSYCCPWHVLGGGTKHRSIFPGFQMGTRPWGPCFHFILLGMATCSLDL